jgi:predicted Zn-dependent protease
VFSTHPSSDQRLQEVVGIAHDFKESSTDSTFVGRTEYLQRVDGMVYGESAANGLIRGRDFYHGDLGFAIRFPDNWKIINLPDRLIGASANGSGMLQIMVRPADPRISPQAFMEKNLGLPAVTNGQELTINGLKAYTGTAVINTDVGKRLSRMTVIYLQNMAFIMAGRTRDTGGLGHYDKFFMESIRSFRGLNNDERRVASSSNRIKIFRADETTSFDKLAASAPLDKFQEQQLRLINGLYPQGEIKPGELAKTVQN